MKEKNIGIFRAEGICRRTQDTYIPVADSVCCNRGAGTYAVCVPLENYQRGN